MEGARDGATCAVGRAKSRVGGEGFRAVYGARAGMKTLVRVIDGILAFYLLGMSLYSLIGQIMWSDTMPKAGHIWMAMGFVFGAAAVRFGERAFKEDDA